MPGDVPEISRQDADRLVNSPREKLLARAIDQAIGVLSAYFGYITGHNLLLRWIVVQF